MLLIETNTFIIFFGEIFRIMTIVLSKILFIYLFIFLFIYGKHLYSLAVAAAGFISNAATEEVFSQRIENRG